MRELSLHVLDVVQNSLEAGATVIDIAIAAQTRDNLLRIEVADNGPGIAPENLAKVLDPFYTSRHTRRVGLGLSLLQAAAIRSGGDLTITSRPGAGTIVTATFQYDNIDRAPLGNMVDTLVTLIVCNPAIRFRYRQQSNADLFEFDSWEIKDLLQGENVLLPQVAAWLKKHLQQNVNIT